MGLISSLNNITTIIGASQQAASTFGGIWSWFTGLHLSAVALFVIAGLLLLLGGKVAKGIVYLIAFILIIIALITMGVI